MGEVEDHPEPIRLGRYDQLRLHLDRLLDELEACFETAGVSRLEKEISELRKKLTQTIYWVAVAGPSRAGKSTLTNALLERPVSPTREKELTTIVPIAYQSGGEDRVKIRFEDGDTKVTKLTPSVMDRYATRGDFQRANHPQTIEVWLRSPTLEAGLGLLDLPGLDDPVQKVSRFRESALDRADAIVYTINAAGWADGGFALNKYHQADLDRLNDDAERVFIALTKSDLLSSEDQAQFRDYIESELTRYGFAGLADCPIIPVSAKADFRGGERQSANWSGIDSLKDIIRDHLLRQNSVGVAHLDHIAFRAQDLLNEGRTVIRAKALEAHHREKLTEKITFAKSQQPTLKEHANEFKKQKIDWMESHLDKTRDERFREVKNDLEKFSSSETDLDDLLEYRLENIVTRTSNEVADRLEADFVEFASRIDDWRREVVQEVRASLTVPDSAPRPEWYHELDLETRPNDRRWEKGVVFGYIGASASAWSINPIAGAIITASLPIYYGLRRIFRSLVGRKDSDKRVVRVEKSLTETFLRLQRRFRKFIRSNADLIEDQARQDLEAFIADLSESLDNAGELTRDDIRKLRSIDSKLQEVDGSLETARSKILGLSRM